MRGLFWLIILLIGSFYMLREKVDNKKYPNTYQAHFARSNKLHGQIGKMEKRYGKDSDQTKAAYKEWIDERAAYEANKEKN